MQKVKSNYLFSAQQVVAWILLLYDNLVNDLEETLF